MHAYLVLYGTVEGQTEKVARRIGETLESRGNDVTVAAFDEIEPQRSIEDVDAVVLGSSIHVGKHHQSLPDFVDRHLSELEAHPTALFQVSLSSAVDEPERRQVAASYVDVLLEETGWNPDRIGMFGGALRYSKYGFLKRLLMKRIAAGSTGDVDTSRDFEYTDWSAVEAFAADFDAFVDGRLADT